MTPNAITIRRARPGDLDAINIVEAGSTPGLRYVARAFDDFVSDEVGQFSGAEIDAPVVACRKFRLMPDPSARLHTPRVPPSGPGLGRGRGAARLADDRDARRVMTRPDAADLKRQAAERAVEAVQSGMVVGLGTGSTAVHAVRRHGALLAPGQVQRVTGHPPPGAPARASPHTRGRHVP